MKAQRWCPGRPEDDEPLSIVAREIGGSPLLADVSDPATPSRIANELKSQHGGLDIVVHNAGITRDRRLARMPEGTWDQVIGINLEALIRITESLLEHGTLHDDGRIVSLSSISGIAGNNGQTNYGASKAGVIGFTRFLSAQLRSRAITVKRSHRLHGRMTQRSHWSCARRACGSRRSARADSRRTSPRRSRGSRRPELRA